MKLKKLVKKLYAKKLAAKAKKKSASGEGIDLNKSKQTSKIDLNKSKQTSKIDLNKSKRRSKISLNKSRKKMRYGRKSKGGILARRAKTRSLYR